MTARTSLTPLILSLCLAAAAGCGGDDSSEGMPDAGGDLDGPTGGVLGDWTIASIDLEGTTHTRGASAGVAGRISISPTQLHVELIKLMAGLPIGSVDAMMFDLVIDGDALLASGGDATYVFRGGLAGDRLTLTFDADDPRTTDPDAPPTIVLDRAPALSPSLPGGYRALSMLTNAGRVTTGTCVALVPPRGANVAVRYDVELDVSPRLILEVRQRGTYYTDAACATTGTSMSDGATALIEVDGTDIDLFLEPHQGEVTGEIEAYRVADGASATIVWTRVGCPGCDGPQELVLQRR